MAAERRRGDEGQVSLRSPRPEAARAHNEYVDTPLRHENNNKKEPVVPVHTRQPLGGKKGSGPVRTAPLPAEAPSIICRECGRCRCEACREPPAPPSAWLCSDFCYCSLDTCVDYASCLCCVKGLMYHCGSGEDSSWADDPCSCTGSRWLARWSCLGLTSLFLPCLWCYCPLRACADACERTYAACSHRGCTCGPQPLLDPR